MSFDFLLTFFFVASGRAETLIESFFFREPSFSTRLFFVLSLIVTTLVMNLGCRRSDCNRLVNSVNWKT